MFWLGLAIGLVVGFIIRSLWKSRKLSESAAIVKNKDMSPDQKKAELYRVWRE